MSEERRPVTVLTGATAGIGRRAAELIAPGTGPLILVGRDRDRGAQAAEAMAKLSGHGQVFFIPGDLSSMADVCRVADEILARHERVDLLLNNAGALFMARTETVDGFERTFALNHLAYFVFTQRLMPGLKRADRAQVINVASIAHRRARLDFDDLQLARRYNGWTAYQRSKLCNILFTRELARRLEGTGMVTACLHPGFINSSFGSANRGVLAFGLSLAKRWIAEPVDTGAGRLAFLATTPDLQHGAYYERNRPVAPSAEAQSDDAARRLWDASVALTRSWLPNLA